MPLTSRQLARRLVERLGVDGRRRTVGGYRWSGQLPRPASGSVRGPRRVIEKPVRPKAIDEEGN